MLNPVRQSYQEKFVEVLKEQLDVFPIKNVLYTVRHRPIYQDLERIDNTITTILNNIRKKVEGIKRNIPYS